MKKKLEMPSFTKKTKAIVTIVHYAGVRAHVDKILQIAKENNLYVIEDAKLQCIDSFFKGKPLGSLGDLGCFLASIETKNMQCGEGGLLAINNLIFKESSRNYMWEKGTNRSGSLWRGRGR